MRGAGKQEHYREGPEPGIPPGREPFDPEKTHPPKEDERDQENKENLHVPALLSARTVRPVLRLRRDPRRVTPYTSCCAPASDRCRWPGSRLVLLLILSSPPSIFRPQPAFRSATSLRPSVGTNHPHYSRTTPAVRVRN